MQPLVLLVCPSENKSSIKVDMSENGPIMFFFYSGVYFLLEVSLPMYFGNPPYIAYMK